jgi:hypothetical protein
MKGVQYYYDDKGEPSAVLIDLKKNPEIWEDFRDIMIVEKRQNGPTVPHEKVRKNLIKKKKLSK